MTTWTRIAITLGSCLIASELLSGALIPSPHNAPESTPRIVDFTRPGPCATCGHAAPITITCDGHTITTTEPGTVPQVAANHCRPGTTYSWSVPK